jgi:hypothetical protein
MGRISHCRWTFHVTVTTSGRLLATTGYRLLTPAISRSILQHSTLTVRSGLLDVVDVMGSSTRRIAVLCNAIVDDTTLAYFVTTHDKTSLCKFDPNVVDLLIFMKILGYVSILK